MVADPCTSELIPGLYGSSEGLLARLKNQYHVPKLADPHPPTTCGYCLWCPDFTNEDTTGTDELPSTDQGNLFIWQSNDSTKFADNSESSPFGIGIDAGTTKTLPDPAVHLLKSDIVSDARCIGACMQLTYFGTMMNSAGEVGFISNLPVSECLTGGVGNNSFSVDELMNYSTKAHRFGTDTEEAIYRLNDQSSGLFRDHDTKLLNVPLANTSKVTTVAMAAKTLGPRMFGFVWRNTSPDAGLTLAFTKSIEWRSEAASGLTQTPIHSYGASKVPAVNAVIQRAEAKGHPMWERTMSHAGSAAGRVANAAFTGVGNALVSKGINMVESTAMSAIEGALLAIAL
jgi:hypothetical protein